MGFRSFISLSLALAALPALAQTDIEAGRRSYEVCAGCHGFVGEGNRIVGAPRLAGIETWYLERQMQNFQAERRGHVDGDTNGRRMALIAQAIDSDRELSDVLAWIATLPIPENASGTESGGVMTAAGDASRGQSLYALCSACHGADGQGNEVLGAPALVTLDEWYFAEQLRLYADGLRGTHPADAFGTQMRALASSFDSEQERQNLASYVSSLRR